MKLSPRRSGMTSAAGGQQKHLDEMDRVIARLSENPGSFRRSISERAGQRFAGSLGPSYSGKLLAAWKSSRSFTPGAGRGIGVRAFRFGPVTAFRRLFGACFRLCAS